MEDETINMSAKSLFALIFIAACAYACTPIVFGQKFDFGTGKPGTGRVKITEANIYNKEKGFGFEPGAAIKCEDSGCMADKPFYFSAAVPEGNYRVKIVFGDKDTATSTTVRAELRRLMLERVETKKGQFVTKTFIVNVRTPHISTGEVKLKDREKTMEWWAWDEKLTLEFNGARPRIRAIEIEPVSVPTVFLLGDSTVCDQPREPYASWGQMFTVFFGTRVAIANHAESGESLKSSLGAGRLDKVLDLIKKGDYLLIQYGHNDEKEKGDGVGAFTTYKASLKHFIAEARKKGGIPIVITPVQRRTFDKGGKITNSHGDYPEAVRQAAKEENVPLLDLNAMSGDLYETLGPDGSGVLFKEGDGTHHNNYGAYELAKCIAQAIREGKLPLAKYLIKGLPGFDPKKPDPAGSFSIPPSPMATDTKPLGN
jgi:lysophospholipase L1-like esterase